MTTACLPGKPLNVGRGIRLCQAAWQTRQRAEIGQRIALLDKIINLDSRKATDADRSDAIRERNRLFAEWNAPPAAVPPPIVECHFECDGKILGWWPVSGHPFQAEERIAA